MVTHEAIPKHNRRVPASSLARFKVLAWHASYSARGELRGNACLVLDSNDHQSNNPHPNLTVVVPRKLEVLFEFPGFFL